MYVKKSQQICAIPDQAVPCAGDRGGIIMKLKKI